MTPNAMKRAAAKKNIGPDTITVMNRKMLNAKNHPGYFTQKLSPLITI